MKKKRRPLKRGWKKIPLLFLITAAFLFSQSGESIRAFGTGSRITASGAGSAVTAFGADTGTDAVCAHADTEIEGAVEATCLETGYTGDLVCLDCGAVLEYGEEISLADHTWDEGVTTQEADCTTAGAVTYTCTVCGATRTDAVAALGHDYSLVEFVSPTSDEDGYAIYECTRCGDSYTQFFAATDAGDTEFVYGDLSEATSTSLTFYVGYFGMSYVEKSVLSLDEILANCVLVTQTYSYINNRPRAVYDVATGPLLLDVLDYAGIDVGSVSVFRIATSDSAENYFGGEYTYDLIFQRRYYYPLLSLYFTEDGFTDITEAQLGAEQVQPMLAVWDSWRTYDIGEEFDASNHSELSAINCFRLLFGQTTISEVDAVSSAKWITAIYIQYSGSPTIDAGDDLELKISGDYKVTAEVSSADETLTEAFQDAIVWSSSDESVVKVDADTGQITVVGEGTAEITASADVGGMTVTDSLTVTVTADDEESLDGGGGGGAADDGNDADEAVPDSSSGSGSGEESGSGSGTGSGSGGTGTTDGSGSGSGNGTDSGSGSSGSDSTDSGSGSSDSDSADADSDSSDESTSSADASSQTASSGDVSLQDSVRVAYTDDLPDSLMSVEIAGTEEILESTGTDEEDGESDASGLLVRGVSIGSDGGGGTAEEKAILLTLTEDVSLFQIGIFVLVFFAAGGVIMIIKYKKEI
ncbi:MAG: hypothetical protein LUF32_07110 [Clostridiales bacterium]|nr:hypothetical protein [Clostridiales bacterium]